MNNEWLNSLRSRMEDHEENVPEELWDDIRDELFSEKDLDHVIPAIVPEEQEITGKDTVGRGSRRLFYRIGAAAAAAVLFFVMMKILPDTENEKIFSKKNGKERNKVNPAAEKSVIQSSHTVETGFASGLSLTEPTTKFLKDKHSKLLLNEESNEKSIQRILELNRADLLFHQKPLGFQQLPSAKELISLPAQEKGADEVLSAPEKQPEKYADHRKSKSAESWMLSMLTGNASPNGAEQQFPGYASMSGKPMNIGEVWSTSTYDENPLTQVLLANQSQPVEARIRHKVPVTLGLSLYYNLGKRWGIGTGLNYTKLASELHSGSAANYIKGEQTIHYVGIPVQVNYNVVQKGRFTGYITGGGLVEKPVAGNLTTSYVVNDEVKESSREKLDTQSLQFSVNTAVGLQLKVIDRLGVYAEPGIGYHFKDNNSLNTAYKEKPLQFNMKFGIRLLLD
ncbi:MAG: PorT family protein [Chryseobacterium sp.]|uniref:outer membrane beta-barrel protein n=1 Tax=Chryseobacterium sp. TaxID=1871047 RepID=UPI0025C3CDE1|nr:outer membrane beta-barrel protein [Chryseobacterium sp.]MCJ7934110.1 PorT family protein [Chryseobacterium sp.]